ncbi:MAG: ABC transporter ATP-binding protein [Bryobacterales bacterium]|nr:ABC transporter ATP-binding protein [Bryobacterales bacterium]
MANNTAPAIETVSLSKQYRSFPGKPGIDAVCSVSLSVPRGATFGLLGPNGSGKTTLVKMLLGMIAPSSGQARLFGVAVGEPRSRLRVGYLPENGRYPAHHTARSLLNYLGRLSGLGRAALARRVDEVLLLTGMREWDSLKLSKHSKGMLQRVGLAQALLHRPELLILDEPSDGVDPLGRDQFRNVLAALNAEGVTIFLNSHALWEAEQLCGSIAILQRGRLLLSGSVAELTSRKGYSLTCVSPRGDLPQGLDHLADATPQALDRFDDGRVRWRVDASNLELLNAIIDLLRRHDSQIEKIEEKRLTLEQIFLDAVRGGRA